MINRQSVIDVLQERQNYYAERNESKQMFAIVNAIDDVLNLPSANPWHTGTPTEEGNYIAHLRIKSRDGEIIEYDMTCNLEVLLNYIRCQDESEENYLMVKGWFRYESYKENEDGHTYQEHGDAC